MPRRRRIQWQRLLPALLILAAVLVGGALGVRALVRSLRAPREDAAVALAIPASARFFPCGEGFVAWDGETIVRCDAAGQEVWRLAADMPGAQAAVSGAFVALFTDSELRLYDANGTLLHDKTVAGITTVRPGTKYVAVLSEQGDPLFRVIDRDGTNIFSQIEQGRTVLDFGLTPNDLLWLLLMDTNGTTATTTVKLYQPAKQSQIGNEVFADDMIYRIVPTKSKLWMLGVSSLYGYNVADMSAKPEQVMIYGWQNIDAFAPYESDLLGLARAEAIDRGQIQSLWMLPPATPSETFLQSPALAATSDGRSLFLLTEDAAQTQRIKEGDVQRQTLAQPVDRVLCVLAGRGFVYESNGAAYWLNMLTP